MTCPKCQIAIPDESAFCLRCGTRLPPPRGWRTATAPAPPRRARGARPGPGARQAAKQAYTLSFGPLVDERLRYRVAVGRGARARPRPGEVQDGLQHGTFVTFLALTADEAEVARQGIHGLGVAPALLRLAPATTAQMLLPPRPARREAAARRPGGLGDWRTLLVAAVGLLVFGVVVVRMIGGRGF